MRGKLHIATVLSLSLIASNLAVANASAEELGEGQDLNTVESTDKSAGTKVVLRIASDSNANPDGGGGDNPPVPPETFSVTVPAELSVSMDLKGNIKVADTLDIQNNNSNAIKLTNVGVTLDSEWNPCDFEENALDKPIDTKDFSIALRGDKMKSDGTIDVTASSWNFGAGDSLPLNARVRIPKQSAEATVDLANIDWEFDWSDKIITSNTDIGSDIPEQKVSEAVYECTVTYSLPEGVSIVGDTTIKVESGTKLKLPELKVNELSKEAVWINSETNEEITTSEIEVTKDLTLTVQLKDKEASPASWFVASGNVVTGLSDEYKSLVDAPTDLVIPNTINGNKIEAIGDNAFKESNLTSVVIPDGVTVIGLHAFYYLSSLTSISIPDSVISINPAAFYNCTALTNITLPNSVMTIGNNAFQNCKSLTNITISNGVTTIGSEAFSGCTSLTSIIIPNSVQIIGSEAFYGVPEVKYSGSATGSPWGALKVVPNN